ncbi:aspartate aminotransferase family protein [bacterium (candidate division B38) B3_B38]|nr:MAG: aspartate aminotransferase family protein [bacterium (candidate division B38) B3_B38]
METKKTDSAQHIFPRDWRKRYPVVERGEGVYLWDKDGRRYMDGAGGSAVVTVGHGNREVIHAMSSQAQKVCFPYIGNFLSQAQIELADKVISFLPPGMSRVYFVSGGSEATEVAIKIARQYHLLRGKEGKVHIISRWLSYHGATLGALSLSGHMQRRKDYLPYLLDSPHIPPPYCYRCPFALCYPACHIRCAEELERTIKKIGADHIAAFIAEPIIGNTAGAVVPPAEYYPIIRETCDKYDILLILDEVITGFGRTGRNFAIDHWGVCPDVLIFGKGISSGYASLGGVAIHEKIFDAFTRSPSSGFFLGYTFSGNPLACSAGLAVLNYIDEHHLVEECARKGAYLRVKASGLKDLPLVGDLRGKGLLMGIELVSDKEQKNPFPQEMMAAETLKAIAMEKGLLLMPGSGTADGVEGDHLVIAPPFTITTEELDLLLDLLESSLREWWKRHGKSHSK